MLRLPFLCIADNECLLSDAQVLDDGPVTFDIPFLEVIEQPASFSDEGHQRPARGEIFTVLLQVAGQVIDPVGKHRNLAF